MHQPLPQHLHQLQPPFVFTFPQSGPVPRADYLLQPGSLEICPYGPLYTLSDLIPIESFTELSPLFSAGGAQGLPVNTLHKDQFLKVKI